MSGVADVAFLGNRLYALESGAGCSHGLAGTYNSVIRVDTAHHTWSPIANLSQFLMTHPVKHPEADDFEPDGTWYSMIAVRGNLYAVEPNHGELDRITPRGHVSRVADISASQGHVVPTSVAYRGSFFIGNLGTFPVVAGAEKIFRVNPAGHVAVKYSGLTTVVGLAFDHRNRLYALELTSVSGDGPTPGTGTIVRIDPWGRKTTIATGLMFPTAMTFDPSGRNLYVSTFGLGFPPGSGQVVKVSVHG